MRTLPKKGLYAITDCRNLKTGELLNKTEIILDSGAVMLQYRNKTTDKILKYKQSEKLQVLCNKYNVPLIINDDIEMAHSLQVDGVHIGRNDTSCTIARKILGPESIIGVSCYNDIYRAMELQGAGASYLAFGAFFPTTTKKNTINIQPAVLIEAKKKLALPLVAIGGITPENGEELVKAGADFIAAASGIYKAVDQKSVTENYTKLFK